VPQRPLAGSAGAGLLQPSGGENVPCAAFTGAKGLERTDSGGQLRRFARLVR
jgi:hypothetical protein